MRISTVLARESLPSVDERVMTYGVSWSQFEARLRLRGERSAPRISYCDGVMEVMSPGKDHERIKCYIGRLLEAYALETGIDLSPYGSWTLKNKLRAAGAEADECYIVGTDQDRESPDLVIEVVWTSGGLDKLEIYKRLEIGEFWQWRRGQLEIHVLRGGRYERVHRSVLFPDLDLDLLVAHLDRPTAMQAIRAYRATLARRAKAPRRPRR